jgi:hypothetical protein
MPQSDIYGNIYTTDPTLGAQAGFTIQPLTGAIPGGGVNPQPSGGVAANPPVTGVTAPVGGSPVVPTTQPVSIPDTSTAGTTSQNGFQFGTAPIHRDPTPFYAQATGYDATTYNPASYTAAQTNVTGDQLVENRLNGLLSSDNPYIQRARTRSSEAASGRGLLNSSIAAGAGEAAAIDAALPIAQDDARRYGTVADNNTVALNDSYFRNADFAQTANRDNSAAITASDKYNSGEITRTDAENADRVNDRTDDIMSNAYDWDRMNQSFKQLGILNAQAQQIRQDDNQFIQQLNQESEEFTQNLGLSDSARGVADGLVTSFSNAASIINTDPTMTSEDKTSALQTFKDMIPGITGSWALIYEQFGSGGEYASLDDQLNAILGGA